MTALLYPIQRLIALSLSLVPNQTEAPLQGSTATETRKHLRRSLRTLQIANLVVVTPQADRRYIYSIGGAA
jgi:hypothetical protein